MHAILTKTFTIYFLITGLIFSTTGCSNKLLSPAVYDQKFGKSISSWESEHYKFNTDNTFEYMFNHDAILASKYGFGNYKIRNNKLILEFTDEPVDLPKSTIISKKLHEVDTSQIYYQFKVRHISGINLPFLNVSFNSLDKKIIKWGTTDENGSIRIRFPKDTPALLKVMSIGYESLAYKIEPSDVSLLFEITMAEKIGTRITNIKVEKRIQIYEDRLVIEGKKFEKSTADNLLLY